MDLTPDTKRKPSWATLTVLTLVVAGVAAFVLAGGPGWFMTSAQPTPSASPTPLPSPSASPSPSPSAKPTASPAPALAKKWNITIGKPATLLGRARNTNTSGPHPTELRRMFPYPDARMVMRFYGSFEAKNRVNFIATATNRLGNPEGEVDAIMNRMFAAMGKGKRVVIDPGPLGGFASCAYYNDTFVNCFWADEGSIGVIDLSSAGGMEAAKKQFIQARGQIERKVPR